MPASTGKPAPGTKRRLNSIDAEVTGLSISGGWWVVGFSDLFADGGDLEDTAGTWLIQFKGPAQWSDGGYPINWSQTYDSESPPVKALEAHWAARVKAPKRIAHEPRPRPAPLVAVVSRKRHWRDPRRRVETLRCGHEMTVFMKDPKRTHRRCAQCAKGKR